MTDESQARHKKRRLVVFIGLALAIALDTSVQLLWKASVPRHRGVVHTLSGTFFNWLFQLSLVLHIWQFFNWLMVLGNADLSFAQPITALSYVTVTALSVWLFHEVVAPQDIVGIALILAGVYLVSSTPSETAGAPGTPAAAPVAENAA